MSEPLTPQLERQTQIIRLPEVMDLRAATPLRAQILACRGANLVLQASDVRRLGAQCLQVLLAAAAAWRRDGSELALAEPSEAFTDGLQLFGCDPARLAPKDQLS